MSVCNALLSGGNNQECQIAMSEIKNVLITEKDVKFSYKEKDTLANWTDKIKKDLTIAVLPGLANYSPTTDDPNIVTSPVGKTKKITNTPIPSFEFMLETNNCDFKEILQTLRGGNYGVFFEMQDGTIEGWIDQSGNDIGYFKPFLASINAFTKGAQEVDSDEAYKLYVFFKKYSQVENYYIFSPTWAVDELLEAMPVGLTLIKTSPYITSDQPVNVQVRCGNNYTGLTAADFEVSADMSNVAQPVVSAVSDDGGGNYMLTVEKEATPVPLVSGDYVALRVVKQNISDISHLSGWIKVEGV